MFSEREDGRQTTPLISASLADSDKDDYTDTGEDLEDILDRIDYGRFHHILLLLLAWAISSDAVEIVCVSFILPSLQCDLEINAFMKGWLNATIFIGMMIGGYFWGSLGDIWGRRSVLIACLLLNGLCALTSSLAQTFWVFILLRLVSGIGVGGSYPVVFSYFAEFQPRRLRGRTISLLSSCWMFAGMATAGLAWAIVPQRSWGYFSPDFVFNSWRIFVAICSLPALTAAIMVVLLPESPRFLLKARKNLEALEVLNRMAVTNGKIQPGESISECIFLDADVPPMENRMSVLHRMKDILQQLFSVRWRRVMMINLVVYFVLAFGYYGILLWLPELFKRMEERGGSPCSLLAPSSNVTHNVTDPCDPAQLNDGTPYFNSFLVNVCNLPGNILSFLLIEKVGRRPLLTISMLLTAVAVFFIVILKSSTEALVMSCVFGALSAVAWNSLAVIGSEILPTHLRATAIGLGQFFNRIGAILGNVLFGALVDANCAIPLVLSASLMAGGGLTALLWPETAGMNIN